jgi:hypothetical protein
MLAQPLSVILIHYHLFLLIFLILFYDLFEANSANTFIECIISYLCQHTISLHNYLVIKGLVTISLQQKILTPTLALARHDRPIFKFLEATFNYYHNFLTTQHSLLEDWIIGLERGYLHSVDDSL